jgi:Arc/MetJ-type ribon-helix-helix transcriptional regulator
MSWTVNLSDKAVAFAEAEVAAGRYASVVDVVVAGLQLLMDQYEAGEAATGTHPSPDEGSGS